MKLMFCSLTNDINRFFIQMKVQKNVKWVNENEIYCGFFFVNLNYGMK